MPHIGQSLVKVVGQYGWTMYSVLGLRIHSMSVPSGDGAKTTANTQRMLEWPVKVHRSTVNPLEMHTIGSLPALAHLHESFTS